MIEKIIAEIKPFLPLKISEVECDGNLLELRGQVWKFTTVSVWRLSLEDRVLFACYNSVLFGCGVDGSEEIKKIRGLEIISIDYQNSLLKADPVFTLSSGQRLEIFSTRRVNPWTFEIKKLGIFHGTQSDSEAL